VPMKINKMGRCKYNALCQHESGWCKSGSVQARCEHFLAWEIDGLEARIEKAIPLLLMAIATGMWTLVQDAVKVLEEKDD
jgi:hypothetical protein